MPSPQDERAKVFVSYSRKDGRWLKRLQVHLKDLERRGLVELWDDTKLQTGTQWRDEINNALDSARVAILLISADFIASDFIANNELPPLLAKAEENGVVILPLILSPSRFDKIESLSRFMTVNPPSEPLIELSKAKQERYLVKLSEDVLRAIEDAHKASSGAVGEERQQISNPSLPSDRNHEKESHLSNTESSGAIHSDASARDVVFSSSSKIDFSGLDGKWKTSLSAISDSTWFRPGWKYGELTVDAIMLAKSQILPNWETMTMPAQSQVDLHGQILVLLEQYEGKQPLLIALTGQRGTARTATMRRLVLETAMESLQGDSHEQVLPIYIDLQKHISLTDKVPSYLTLLTQSLKEFWPVELTENEMSNLLLANNRKLRLFFDHGDRLSKDQRLALIKELIELNQDFPRHACLITITRGEWDWLAGNVTQVLDVQPLSRRRIVRFLTDCINLEAKLHETGGAETQQSPEEFALKKLLRRLEERQLFDLASMPWMLVQLIKQALNNKFPETRVNILQDLIEDKVSYITQRHSQQECARDTLYELAYQMQRQNLSTLPIKDALGAIAQVRGNHQYELEEMLDSLIQADLLDIAGGHTVRFLYSQYQAYCCAQYLYNLDNPKQWESVATGLGCISYLRQWEDVLTFLAGLVTDPNDLLEKISYSISLKDGEVAFLAARCLLEAQLSGNAEHLRAKSSYVESLVVDALIWRSDGTNEPSWLHRLRAIEWLGRLRRVEVLGYLVRTVMEKTQINSVGERSFEYGIIRQAAGRSLFYLLPPSDQPDNEFTEELRRLCPELEELIQRWICGGYDNLIWLTSRMMQPNEATNETERVVNDALASMAAFALGDLPYDEVRHRLFEAFLDISTTEVIRWAITDALTSLNPDEVMRYVILPLIKSGNLDDAVKFSKFREQLIYLIGQIHYPDEKARVFVENALTSPGVPSEQKGRAILALCSLRPPNWKSWKVMFEEVTLGKFKAISETSDNQSEKGLYLRIKALQALAEIGDLDTLHRLRAERRLWPTELERLFYSVSEEIIWRNNN